MSEAIKNRYDFVILFDVENGNPNGDPDAGNMPRVDPETGYGLVTDVCLKRKIRNYVETVKEDDPGYRIYIKDQVPLQRSDAEALQYLGVSKDLKAAKKDDPELDRKIRDFMCQNFFDIRTFGAVMTTFVKGALNCGQVRGPVQSTYGKSLDAVLPLDISITRMAVADKVKDGATVEDYAAWEQEQPEDKLRTMGRKQIIPFGLYEVRGFVSANLAEETGFDDEDLNVLFEAILNMYEHDHSASKGEMAVVSPLIIFRHVGTDTDAAQRIRQAKLGCAPAHKLFDLVKVTKKASVSYPRSYRDYDALVSLDRVPKGVQIGFKPSAFEPVVWDALPADEDWFCHG